MVIRRGNSEDVLRNKLLTNQASLTEHIPNEIVEVNESKESSKRSASTLEHHRDYLKNNRGKTSLDGPIGGIDMTQAQNRIEFGTLEDYSHGLDTNEFLEKMQRNMKRNDGAEVIRGDLENEEIEGVNRTASRILTDKLNLYMTEQSFGAEHPRPSQDKKNMFYNGTPGQSEYQTGGTTANKLGLKANLTVGKGKHLRDTFGDIAIQSQGKPKDFEEELRRNEQELNQQLEKYKEMMDEEEVRHRSVSRSGKGSMRDKGKGGRKGKGKSKGKGKKHRYKHHSEMESVLHEGNQMGEILMDQKGRIRKDTLGSSNKKEVKTAKKGDSVHLSKPEGNQNLIEEKAESVKSDLFEEKDDLPKDMMISNKIVTHGALKHDVSETTRITSESGPNTETKAEDINFTSINPKTENTKEKLDIIDSKTNTEDKSRKSSKKGVEMTLEFDKGGNVGKKRDIMLKKLEKNRKRMIKSRSKKKFNGSPGFKRNNNKFATSKSRNISRNNSKSMSRNVSKSFNKSPNRNLSKNRNLTKPKPKSKNMGRNMNRNSSNRNKSRTLSRNMSKKYMSTKGRPTPASLKKNLINNHNSVNRRGKPGYKTNGSKVSRGTRNSIGTPTQFNKTGESKRFEDDEDSKQVSGVEWTEKTKEGDEDDSIYKRYQAKEGDELEGTVEIDETVDIEGTVDNEGTIEMEMTTEVERRQDNEGTQEVEREGGNYETQEVQEEQENRETQEPQETEVNDDTQETIKQHQPHSNQREPRKDSEPMEWIEEQESTEFQDQEQTGSRRFKTMDISPEHQHEMITHGPKISEGSNIRNKFEETRARFKENNKLNNDFQPGEIDRKSNRSVKKLIPHSKSPMRGKSPGGSRKLNLPKYMTKKNSKFNRNTSKHIRGPNNYLKMNYIIKNVLLVGGWNHKRRQVYLEMVKANKKCHMVVVFKNKNGHDCLGKFLFCKMYLTSIWNIDLK